MKVTRILHAKRPNRGKVAALREQARRLGRVRSEVWQRFGSILPDTAAAVASVLTVGLLAAALLVLALWGWLRASGEFTAPPIALTGTQLYAIQGKGERGDSGLRITRLGPDQTAMVQAPVRGLEASAYARLTLELEGMTAGQRLSPVWERSGQPTHWGSPLAIDTTRAVARTTVRLDRDPHWHGPLIGLGVALQGPLDAPVTVRGLWLEPRAPSLAQTLDWLAAVWTYREPWSLRSINFHVGAPPGQWLTPPLLVAAWVALALGLHAVLQVLWKVSGLPRRARVRPRLLIALFVLLGWAALDLRWQLELFERLGQTVVAYRAVPADLRSLSPPDDALRHFADAVRERMTDPTARLYLLSQDPEGFGTVRLRYHLGAVNASVGLAELPASAESPWPRAGDYLLALPPQRHLRYDAERQCLATSQHCWPVSPLFGDEAGLLLQVREAH